MGLILLYPLPPQKILFLDLDFCQNSLTRELKVRELELYDLYFRSYLAFSFWEIQMVLNNIYSVLMESMVVLV